MFEEMMNKVVVFVEDLINSGYSQEDAEKITLDMIKDSLEKRRVK